jgi:aerobic carbon-monoxide dehydrogenase medium subunit
MKPPPFQYFCPGTLEEALSLLARMENAKVLAGGQSLMAMLNLRYVFPDVLVDINNLFDLAGVDIGPERIRIGAMTRQSHIERHEALFEALPMLRAALHLVGHRQTRNRGTIGGSLCHLDPAAELPLIALLLDATIEAKGPGGVRRIPCHEFIAGFMMPGIAAEEIVTAVEIAPWRANHSFGFHEFARRHGDFAIASAAVQMQGDASGAIERVAIAVGGIGSVPQRYPVGEALLLGTTGETQVVESVIERCAELELIGDFHGGTEYRLSVARTMLRRSLHDALKPPLRVAGA